MSKPQVPPLRFAPVGMTIYIFVRDASAQEKLSSRPEESWACGPPKVMKNTFCPPTALLGSIALPFVIPSVAEGSAVPRTIPGNVFRQSETKWRDLRLKAFLSAELGRAVLTQTLSRGISRGPALKRGMHRSTPSRSAEALLPPRECGGSHPNSCSGGSSARTKPTRRIR
jgi:hypothetical protein